MGSRIALVLYTRREIRDTPGELRARLSGRESLVAEGAFLLKSALSKGSLGGGHEH